LRGAFDALMAIDGAMGDVVASATEPALAAIKLAWWRERLEDLDAGKVPAEPRLQAAAAELLPRGVTGTALAGLEDGWAAVVEEPRDTARALERGARLFAIAAQLLGADDPLLGSAGRIYAWQTMRRRGLVADADPPTLVGTRVPRRLRPLTALARLAARDLRQAPVLEPEATPGRAWALLLHRFTGRIT
jgi:15-cis-phytoene synthase